MSEPWEAIHTAADSQRPAFQRSLVAGLNAYRHNLDRDALRGLVGQGSTFRAIWDLVDHARARKELLEAARKALIRTAELGYRAEERSRAKTFRESFDLVNPETVAWVETYSLELITAIDDATREAIRALLLRSANGELTVDRVAKLIGESIGLTPTQAVAMENVERDAFDKALKAGKSVAQAQEMAGKAAERYRKAAIKMRAENIARTETLRAANAGQQALWNQHIKDGLLPVSAMKIWIVTPDDRLCPRCRQLRDLEAPVSEPFQTPEGEVDYPPLHPRCRCAMGISRL